MASGSPQRPRKRSWPASRGQLADDLVGARVLPVDGVVHRHARLAVPDDGRLALVGDAQRDEVGGLQRRVVERALHDLHHVAPDLLGVVLDPARAREDLLVLLLRDGDDAGRAIEDHAARGRGALIDRGDVLLAHRHRVSTKGSLRVRVKLRVRPRERTPPGRRGAGAPPAAGPADRTRPSRPPSLRGGPGSAPRTRPGR